MEPITTALLQRQIWENPSTTFESIPHSCSIIRLPSGGLLNLGGQHTITLQNDAVFQPGCASTSVPQPVDPSRIDVDLPTLDREQPFYSSTNPQIYAISAVTIVSYMLVIILFITPRTFHVGGVGGGANTIGRRGTIGASYGSSTVIGIGSRPWLQKLAALTLGISLTIVSVNTFKWAEQQYNDNYQDAEELSRNVINSLEIRIVRLISESFLWLAQAQTLIRLFQRHKEKLVIKWIAFVLITLEIVFGILDYFVNEASVQKPRVFANSIPALNYLFSLALNTCYAAFVLVYALRKRRFAFFHPQMHSMPLTALLSITAVLIPAIFFILDLSKPNVSGWGSYVRWVGACAASVVVWEWVERIEALERKEKKDGILGREIFDGDEMLESQRPNRSWPTSSLNKNGRGGRGGGSGNRIATGWSGMARAARHLRRSREPEPKPLKDMGSDRGASLVGAEHAITAHQPRHAAPPSNDGISISRDGTPSLESTVYMVQYHSVTQSTPPIPEELNAEAPSQAQSISQQLETTPTSQTHGASNPAPKSRLSRLAFPLKRQRHLPPAEVAAAIASQSSQSQLPHSVAPSSIFGRLRLRGHQSPIEIPSGVIVIPAPPRRRSSFDNSLRDGDDRASDSSLDDRSSGGEDRGDRPPAAVRHALRVSNPPTPATEHWQSVPLFGNAAHASNQLPQQTLSSQHSVPVIPAAEDPNVQRTNHDR